MVLLQSHFNALFVLVFMKYRDFIPANLTGGGIHMHFLF